MPIITTYICDVSGESGNNKEDFVQVELKATTFRVNSSAIYMLQTHETTTKFIHRGIAEKLHLIPARVLPNKAPVPTFESQLKILLTDFVDTIVSESLDNR